MVIFAAIALSSIFYDFRRTLIVQILGMVVVVVVAWLLVSEMMVIDPKLQANSGNLASWIVRGLLLALLSTALVLASNYLVTSFERSLSSLQKQTEHLSSLQETTLDILAHKKMGDLLDSLIKRAADLVNADGGVFFLVDQNEENLTMMGGRGKEKNQLRKKIRRGTGVAGRVLESKEPLIVPDYSQWPEREAEEEPYWGSISQVPVFLNEKVIGVLGCYTLAGNLRIFSQDDLFIIEGLARQAAVAIENINLIDAAQQAEAKLEAIVQAAPSAIISADREQHIIMFNKAAENMFGYSADEIMDKDANLLLPMRFHDSHPKYVDEFTNKTSNENAILIPRELVGLRANGEEFPVEVSVSKVDNKGKMILTVIMQDITERKQTQDALRESEAYTRMLLEFSRDLELSQTYQDILAGALGIPKKTIG
ncbi:MAG: PAS domain S-box protein, partial [Anaerolineae bacterium]|nr:PAS domain S-box protein [Anaerolineae bacterium]